MAYGHALRAQSSYALLVTGATGYIGGRLAPRLLDAGHEVRCLTRSAGRLRDVPWAAGRRDRRGRPGRPGARCAAAFEGVDVAYYLVHSLGPAATSRRRPGRRRRTSPPRPTPPASRRIVYLGGPEPPADEQPSAHLRSRAEVAEILLTAGCRRWCCGRAVIIGSGSASFEMLRYLTERLPVMVTPRWVRNRIQPIAVRDVLHYLVGAAELPAEVNRGFDIGGPDVLTYREMMQRLRPGGRPAPRGSSCRCAPLTPGLSAHWVGLVTPVPNAIARPLVGSLIHEAVAHEHDIAGTCRTRPAG